MLRILHFFLHRHARGRQIPGQFADVVQWQNTSLPSWLHGFDSRCRLHRHRTAKGPIPPKVWARAGDPGPTIKALYHKRKRGISCGDCNPTENQPDDWCYSAQCESGSASKSGSEYIPEKKLWRNGRIIWRQIYSTQYERRLR